MHPAHEKDSVQPLLSFFLQERNRKLSHETNEITTALKKLRNQALHLSDSFTHSIEVRQGWNTGNEEVKRLYHSSYVYVEHTGYTK